MISINNPQRGDNDTVHLQHGRHSHRTAWAGIALMATLLVACEGQPETPIKKVNSPPTANAGADREAYSGTTVTLDGANSNDIDGDQLNYQWQQTRGPKVELSLANSATPSFTAPMQAGDLEFSLVVGDGRRNSETDTVTVVINEPSPPTANAGKFVSTTRNGQISLQGSASSELLDANLQINWMQTHGDMVELNAADSLTPSFTAPDQSGYLLFSFKVTDDFNNSDEDSVAVQVLNSAPVAIASVNQRVVGFGDTVELNGSASKDPDHDELSYNWNQVLGSPVELSDSNSAQATFTAPDIKEHLVFELTVSDGEFTSHTDTVYVETSDDAAAIEAAAAEASTQRAMMESSAGQDEHHDDMHEKPHHKAHWTYQGDTGPDHWGSLDKKFALCAAGMEQSPIDISQVNIINSNPIEFQYQPSKLNVVNNGHTIQVNYDAGSHIIKDGTRYDLLQFHFHAPSEHAIEGQQADMVAHLVHKSEAGGLAVVGVLFNRGEENASLKSIWEHMPAHEGSMTADLLIDANELLPGDRGYFHYSGSLTTPPCSEGVNWNVLATPISVSDEQLKAFTDIFPLSVRPLQPINQREIGRY